MGILGLVAPVILLVFIYTKFSVHRFDPVALFCYLFAFFYLFRDAIVSFGLDTPYPSYLFLPSQTPHLLLMSSFVLSAFLISFVVGYTINRPMGAMFAPLVPVAWRVPPLRRQVRLTVLLTAVATFISIGLFLRFGGFARVIAAAKLERELTGSNVLRIVPALGGVVATALILALYQERRRTKKWRKGLLLVAVSAAVLNAAYFMMWGSRQVGAAVILILGAGLWVFRRDPSTPRSRSARPSWMRVILLGGVILMVVFGLRVLRDTLLWGGLLQPVQGSAIHEVSVASDSYFDPTLLALRDWPAVYPYRHGRDFLVGLEGIVPRPLWPSKPEEASTGQWFRQVYQPWTVNGWPLGAVGDWYLNFGFIGIVLGGILAGVLYSVLMSAWRRAPSSPFTFASVMAVILFAIPLGFEARTPLRWVQWAVPLWLAGRYLGGRTPKRMQTLAGPDVAHPWTRSSAPSGSRAALGAGVR
jgi:MFS family permease